MLPFFSIMNILNLFDNRENDEKRKFEPSESSYNKLSTEDVFDVVSETLEDMREGDCNKGTFGTLGCICGSYGMAGAAMLCGSAAMTCGSGIVKMIVPQSIYPIAAANLWEAVFVPVPQNQCGMISEKSIDEILDSVKNCSAIAIGCGLGVSEDTEKLVQRILIECNQPVVVDADGINCLSRHIDILKQRHNPTVLTPHPGEMSRLINSTVAEIQSNRKEIARNFAREYNCTLVLKGVKTIVTNGTLLAVNKSGNGCLAKGGSGDVLT